MSHSEEVPSITQPCISFYVCIGPGTHPFPLVVIGREIQSPAGYHSPWLLRPPVDRGGIESDSIARSHLESHLVAQSIEGLAARNGYLLRQVPERLLSPRIPSGLAAGVPLVSRVVSFPLEGLTPTDYWRPSVGPGGAEFASTAGTDDG